MQGVGGNEEEKGCLNADRAYFVDEDVLKLDASGKSESINAK